SARVPPWLRPPKSSLLQAALGRETACRKRRQQWPWNRNQWLSLDRERESRVTCHSHSEPGIWFGQAGRIHRSRLVRQRGFGVGRAETCYRSFHGDGGSASDDLASGISFIRVTWLPTTLGTTNSHRSHLCQARYCSSQYPDCLTITPATSHCSTSSGSLKA